MIIYVKSLTPPPRTNRVVNLHNIPKGSESR